MKKNKTIAYVLGTKAQFIKTKFVLKNFIENGYEILIIDTGQHREITSKELQKFGQELNYYNLASNQANVSSIPGMIYWFFKIALISKVKIENNNLEYCIIHGDTVSTLIGLIFAKRNNLKTFHIEAGHRSKNWLKPFPEEIIRSVVTKYSNIIAIDDEKLIKNLSSNTKQKIISLKRNTIYDTLIDNIKDVKILKNNDLTVTIHRTENIYNKKKLKSFVDLLVLISKSNNFENIKWYCHDITMKKLVKHKYDQILYKFDIKLKDLIPHDKFVEVLINSKAVITDGGSIAEECFIMNQNTVIWRDIVENKEYLNDNVILSNYEQSAVINFFENLSITYPEVTENYSPSKDLVTQFLAIDS
jgi:UDP-N-acetylglucosamine 2-epimerase (non-hydrolysing)